MWKLKAMWRQGKQGKKFFECTCTLTFITKAWGSFFRNTCRASNKCLWYNYHASYGHVLVEMEKDWDGRRDSKALVGMTFSACDMKATSLQPDLKAWKYRIILWSQDCIHAHSWCSFIVSCFAFTSCSPLKAYPQLWQHHWSSAGTVHTLVYMELILCVQEFEQRSGGSRYWASNWNFYWSCCMRIAAV